MSDRPRLAVWKFSSCDGCQLTLLDCEDELKHARTIVKRGTSADSQLAVYHGALAAGASDREALQQVVDWLIAESVPSK